MRSSSSCPCLSRFPFFILSSRSFLSHSLLWLSPRLLLVDARAELVSALERVRYHVTMPLLLPCFPDGLRLRLILDLPELLRGVASVGGQRLLPVWLLTSLTVRLPSLLLGQRLPIFDVGASGGWCTRPVILSAHALTSCETLEGSRRRMLAARSWSSRKTIWGA